MNRVLKYLRNLAIINSSIREVIYFIYSISQKMFCFFSIHWPIAGIIKLRLPGGEKLKLYSRGDEWIPTQVFWKGFGGYEGKSELLFYLLAKKSNYIIDVGANTGYFSLIAALSNRNAKVFAFEPVKRIFERQLENIRINQLNNIISESNVVSNECNTVAFYIPKTSGMVLAASTKKGWVSQTTKEIIPAVSLDAYKSKHKIEKIDLVKLDCEFHEKEVLEGMQNILQDDKPIILMEVLLSKMQGIGSFSQSHEIEYIMKKNGYYFYIINETALIRTETLENNIDSRNYLFSTRKSESSYIPFSDNEYLLINIL